MVNGVKTAVFKLIDKAFAQSGFVTGVRKWAPDSMCEVDMHLPGVDMSKWTTIPRLKIRVAVGQYRDYTPSVWDINEKTCTLLIETAHEGFGSSWAKSLREGDEVLFAPAHAAGLPSKPGKIACFGDGSALGHFLALKHLTNRADFPMQAHIYLDGDYGLPEKWRSAHPEFDFIMKTEGNSLETLTQVYESNMWRDVSSVYIAGYIPMVTGLRKIFRSNRQVGARIFAHGFWS